MGLRPVTDLKPSFLCDGSQVVRLVCKPPQHLTMSTDKRISQRITTPLRTNKKGKKCCNAVQPFFVAQNHSQLWSHLLYSGLPKVVDAHLILSIDSQQGEETKSFPFIWDSETYEGCSRDKVRCRHRYLVTLKLQSNLAEWHNLVTWAKNYIRDPTLPSVPTMVTTRGEKKNGGKFFCISSATFTDVSSVLSLTKYTSIITQTRPQRANKTMLMLRLILI